MTNEIECPYCKLEGKKGILEKIEFESNFLDAKFRCSNCKKVLTHKTGLGQVAQALTMAIGLRAAMSMLGIDDLADFIDTDA